SLGAIAHSVRSSYRKARRPSIPSVLGDGAVNVCLILALCAVAVLVLFWNYRGFLDSSAVFTQLSFAARVAFVAMPAVFLVFLRSRLVLFPRRGQRVRVFISFHHAREKTAVALERALRAAGLTVRRIPFRDDYHHDTLLQTVQEEIRRCDAVVCLP